VWGGVGGWGGGGGGGSLQVILSGRVCVRCASHISSPRGSPIDYSGQQLYFPAVESAATTVYVQEPAIVRKASAR